MLSGPIIVLILGIFAATFGMLAIGPAGLLFGLFLLVVSGVMFFQGRKRK